MITSGSTLAAIVRLAAFVAGAAVCSVAPKAAPSYESALESLAERCPSHMLAIVPDAYVGLECNYPPDLSFEEGLWWFSSEDASFVPWFDTRERFVAIRPSRRAREWARGRDLPGWSAHEEDFTEQVRALLSALTEGQTASVATGASLAPVSLAPEARAALVAMFGLGDMRPVAEAAVSDPLTRVRIDFAISVGLQVEPAGPVGLPRMGRRATRLPGIPVPPEGPAPECHDGGPEADTPEGGPVIDGRLLRSVTVAQSPITMAALQTMLEEATGLDVGVPPEWHDAPVVLSLGEWECAELLDALSASCVLACSANGDRVVLGDPELRVPEPLLAQLDVAGQWSTLAFGRADLASDEPRPLSDLSEGQRAWLGRSLLAAANDVEPRVTVLPQVTITLEAWDALAPLPGGETAGPDAAPEYRLITNLERSATWFWERLPEGWP